MVIQEKCSCWRSHPSTIVPPFHIHKCSPIYLWIVGGNHHYLYWPAPQQLRLRLTILGFLEGWCQELVLGVRAPQCRQRWTLPPPVIVIGWRLCRCVMFIFVFAVCFLQVRVQVWTHHATLRHPRLFPLPFQPFNFCLMFSPQHCTSTYAMCTAPLGTHTQSILTVCESLLVGTLLLHTCELLEYRHLFLSLVCAVCYTWLY